MTTYKKILRVSMPDGTPLFADILNDGKTVTIIMKPLEAVKKDKPEFARDGRIHLVVERSKYEEAIRALEKYLETLFLGVLENENPSPSVKAKPKPRRNKKSDSKGKVGADKGQRDSASVHTSARGDDIAEGSGRG